MSEKKSTKNIRCMDFGPVYDGYVNNPVAAIKKLRKERKGECPKALFRSGFGYIDIVWGEADPNTHKGFGLAHIIEKHEKTINELGFSVENFISIIIQYGNISEKRSDKNKTVFESSMFRFVVTKRWNGKDKVLLLSAFDLKKKPKK